MEREETQARRNAADKLASLLVLPEDLSKIDKLRATFKTKLDEQDHKIKSLVQLQLDEAQRGKTKLVEAMQMIDHLTSNFGDIHKLCVSCQQLIEDYPTAQLVNMCRQNLKTTIKELHQINAIPREIVKIQELRRDVKNILKVYHRIRRLERMRIKVAQSAERYPREKEVLEQLYFSKAQHLVYSFEQELFKIIESAVTYAESQPDVLIKAILIVEQQEREDYNQMVRAELSGGSVHPENLKQWRHLLDKHLEEAIDRRFREELNLNTGGLGDGGDHSVEQFVDALRSRALNKLCGDLKRVKQFMAACFPPKYQIVRFYTSFYHSHLLEMFQHFAEAPESFPAPATEPVLSWLISEYRPLLDTLEVDTRLLPSLMGVMGPLITRYKDLSLANATKWVHNIPGSVELTTYQGWWVSTGPSSLFEIAHKMIGKANATKCKQLVFEVAVGAASLLRVYQQIVAESMDNLAAFKGERGFRRIVAQVNDCHIAKDYTDELEEEARRILDALPDSEMSTVDDEDEGDENAAKESDDDKEDDNEEGVPRRRRRKSGDSKYDSSKVSYKDEGAEFHKLRDRIVYYAVDKIMRFLEMEESMEDDDEGEGTTAAATEKKSAKRESEFDRFFTKEWMNASEPVMEELIGRISGFLSQEDGIRRFVNPKSFTVMSREVLKRVVMLIVRRLISKKHSLDHNAGVVLKEDIKNLKQFFVDDEELMEGSLFDEIALPLVKLADIMNRYDNPEMVVMPYADLARHSPHPRLKSYIETIISNHSSWTKDAVKQALEAIEATNVNLTEDPASPGVFALLDEATARGVTSAVKMLRKQ